MSPGHRKWCRPAIIWATFTLSFNLNAASLHLRASAHDAGVRKADASDAVVGATASQVADGNCASDDDCRYEGCDQPKFGKCRKGTCYKSESFDAAVANANITWTVCPPPKEGDATVFLGIYTAPTEQGALRRQEVRNTYWNHRFLKPGGPVQGRFVVGWTASDDSAAAALRQEVKTRPSDFVQVDVQESYNNLTSKTLAFMRWFSLNSRAKFVLKMDDDTFPHIDAMVRYLDQQWTGETDEYLHLGLMFACAPVLKFTKWAENPSIWNHSFFPRYMQGSGYFLSAPLVREIALTNYENSRQRMLNNEDAAVGLWIEMQRWEDPNIEIDQHNIPATLTGCAKDDILSMNNQLGYMSCYWNRTLRGEEDVCCYGPLNNLQQSLLQTKTRVALRARSRMRVACYGE